MAPIAFAVLPYNLFDDVLAEDWLATGYKYFRIGHFGHRRDVMGYSDLDPTVHDRRTWNAGQNVRPKRPPKPRDIWTIRFYLDEHRRLRDRTLFDLAIDSKLRGCDLVKLKIGDVVSGGSIRNRSTVIQQKTGNPFNSRSCRKPERASQLGWNDAWVMFTISSFPAAWTISVT